MFRDIWRGYQRSFQGLPAPAWWIAVALFVNRFGAMALVFMTMYVRKKFELPPTQAGILLTVYGGGSIVSAFVGGHLVNRWGALTILWMSLFGSGMAMLTIMSASTFPQLIGAVLGWSLFAEAGRPASASAASEVTAEADQSRALTLNRLAENLGMTFGPAMGGFLADIDFRLLFVVNASTCLLASMLVIWLRRRVGRHVRSEDPFESAQSPLKDRAFLVFLFLMVWLAIALFQLLGTFQLYLSDVGGFPLRHIGLLFAVNTLMIVTMEMPLMHWLRPTPRLYLVAIGSCLLCLGLGLLSFGATVLVATISTIIWTIGEMLCLSPALTFASQRAGAANRGRYLGIYTGAMSVAFLLAPQIGMPIYQWDPRAVWWSMMGLGPVLLLSFVLLARFVGDRTTIIPVSRVAVRESPLL